MVERIRDGLIAVDPGKRGILCGPHREGICRIGRPSTNWIIDTLKDIPDEQRKLVPSHDSFGYFAKRYGFPNRRCTGIESATTEARGCIRGPMAQLIDKVKAAWCTGGVR